MLDWLCSLNGCQFCIAQIFKELWIGAKKSTIIAHIRTAKMRYFWSLSVRLNLVERAPKIDERKNTVHASVTVHFEYVCAAT